MSLGHQLTFPLVLYLHGTRLRYRSGDLLRVDVVNKMPGDEDDR